MGLRCNKRCVNTNRSDFSGCAKQHDVAPFVTATTVQPPNGTMTKRGSERFPTNHFAIQRLRRNTLFCDEDVYISPVQQHQQVSQASLLTFSGPVATITQYSPRPPLVDPCDSETQPHCTCNRCRGDMRDQGASQHDTSTCAVDAQGRSYYTEGFSFYMD